MRIVIVAALGVVLLQGCLFFEVMDYFTETPPEPGGVPWTPAAEDYTPPTGPVPDAVILLEDINKRGVEAFNDAFGEPECDDWAVRGRTPDDPEVIGVTLGQHCRWIDSDRRIYAWAGLDAAREVSWFEIPAPIEIEPGAKLGLLGLELRQPSRTHSGIVEWTAVAGWSSLTSHVGGLTARRHPRVATPPLWISLEDITEHGMDALEAHLGEPSCRDVLVPMMPPDPVHGTTHPGYECSWPSARALFVERDSIAHLEVGRAVMDAVDESASLDVLGISRSAPSRVDDNAVHWNDLPGWAHANRYHEEGTLFLQRHGN